MISSLLTLVKKSALIVIALMLMAAMMVMSALLIVISIGVWCLSRFFPQFRNSSDQAESTPMNLNELRRDIKKGNFRIPKNFNPNGDHNESH